MTVKSGIHSAIPSINITIPQGADYNEEFFYTYNDGSAVDLTGYAVTASLRKHVSAAASTGFSYVGIASSAGGKVKLEMSAAVTGIVTEGRYFYDVKMTSGNGTVIRLVEGNALVLAGIS
jgi:hypothetical protein|tara:strand:- start:1402 stop:1761 length:360 start_codon:yes stop_codon:yes gene_type:complete